MRKILLPMILGLAACSMDDTLVLDCIGQKRDSGFFAGSHSEFKEAASRVFVFKNKVLEGNAPCEVWTSEEIICGYRTELEGYRDIFGLRVERSSGRVALFHKISGPGGVTVEEFEGVCKKIEKPKI